MTLEDIYETITQFRIKYDDADFAIMVTQTIFKTILQGSKAPDNPKFCGRDLIVCSDRDDLLEKLAYCREHFKLVLFLN